MGRQHGSSNWLKVQKHTPDKPEIRQLARRCQCSVGDAFLAWFRVYSYFDVNTADGTLPFFVPADVDDIARTPGVGKVLEEVGWLLFDATGCTVVHWARHNGESAKKRAEEAERQARCRDNRNDNDVQESRESRDKCHAVPVTNVTQSHVQSRSEQSRRFTQDEE